MQGALFDRSEIARSPQDYTIRAVMRDAAALYRESGDWFMQDEPPRMIEEAWGHLEAKAASVSEGAARLVRWWRRRYMLTEWSECEDNSKRDYPR